jgi:hypothetical protein
VRLQVGRAVFSVPSQLEFSDCLEAVPATGPAPKLEEQKLDEQPLWIRYDSESEGVQLRFSTLGVDLFTHDGCLRHADLAPVLFGSTADAGNAVFGGGDPIPTDANELGTAQGNFTRGTRTPISVDGTHLRGAEPTTLRLRGETAAMARGAETLLSVDYDASRLQTWQTSMGAYGRADARWYRFSLSGEQAARGESVTGRNHTVVWSWEGAEPRLALSLDAAFTAKEPELEQTSVRADRRATTAAGTVRVLGSRVHLEDARMVGAGRCPQMEGVLDFEHVSEEVVWTAILPDGSEHRLGDARRKESLAAGCLNEARKEISKSLKAPTLRDGAPKLRLRVDGAWKGRHAAGASISAP